MALPFHVPSPNTSVTETATLRLRTVTPVLGGGVFARQLDAIDIIRTQTLRGLLRFWWRAITADSPSAESLFAREAALWGGVEESPDRENSQDRSRQSCSRSQVRLSISDVKVKGKDTERVNLQSATGYVLWPARATKSEGNQEDAERFAPGIEFTLRLEFPGEARSEIHRMLSAWLMFGGYGSRTRRGVGKIAPNCEFSYSLVAGSGSEAQIKKVLGEDIFSASSASSDWPRLKGMTLAVGTEGTEPMAVWETAIDWLRHFRQGQPVSGDLGAYDPNYARQRGVKSRPSRSNWPEPDKVRQLLKGNWSHAPKHNATPVWPRASLGLPIISQFQTKGRDDSSLVEPPKYQISWVDEQGNKMDRLASPLLIGAMPMANRKFVPFALWLHRAFPRGNVVALTDEKRPPIANSQANFDDLVANGDEARFAPLKIGQSEPRGLRMRTAFFRWLRDQSGRIQIFP